MGIDWALEFLDRVHRPAVDRVLDLIYELTLKIKSACRIRRVPLI